MLRTALCIVLLAFSSSLIAQETLSKPLVYNWSKPLAYDARFELTDGGEQNSLGLQFYLEGRSERKGSAPCSLMVRARRSPSLLMDTGSRVPTWLACLMKWNCKRTTTKS